MVHQPSPCATHCAECQSFREAAGLSEGRPPPVLWKMDKMLFSKLDLGMWISTLLVHPFLFEYLVQSLTDGLCRPLSAR